MGQFHDEGEKMISESKNAFKSTRKKASKLPHILHADLRDQSIWRLWQCLTARFASPAVAWLFRPKLWNFRDSICIGDGPRLVKSCCEHFNLEESYLNTFNNKSEIYTALKLGFIQKVMHRLLCRDDSCSKAKLGTKTSWPLSQRLWPTTLHMVGFAEKPKTDSERPRSQRSLPIWSN